MAALGPFLEPQQLDLTPPCSGGLAGRPAASSTQAPALGPLPAGHRGSSGSSLPESLALPRGRPPEEAPPAEPSLGSGPAALSHPASLSCERALVALNGMCLSFLTSLAFLGTKNECYHWDNEPFNDLCADSSDVLERPIYKYEAVSHAVGVQWASGLVPGGFAVWTVMMPAPVSLRTSVLCVYPPVRSSI